MIPRDRMFRFVALSLKGRLGMDIPHPDEDGFPGGDPLDVIEHVLSAENLSFDRTDDGDLLFNLAGDWKDYELWFCWREDAGCLQLCLAPDIKAASAQYPALFELLGLVNQRVWIGHFELWPDDGELIFRHALPLPEGERPTLAQAAAMIDAAVEAADRFYPAFDFLLSGGKTPAESMASCLFETVGRA